MSGTPFVIGQSEVGGTDVIGGTGAAANPNLVFMATDSVSSPGMRTESITGPGMLSESVTGDQS